MASDLARTLRRNTLVAVSLVTIVIWAYSFSKYTFYFREIWFYLFVFFVPALLVCGAVWMIFLERLWLRIVGGLLMLPALGIWVVSLLLTLGNFKIH